MGVGVSEFLIVGVLLFGAFAVVAVLVVVAINQRKKGGSR